LSPCWPPPTSRCPRYHSAPIADSRVAPISMMSQQCRYLLDGVAFCCVSSIELVCYERLFACLLSDPTLNGCMDKPPRPGGLSKRQAHMASPDHHVFGIVVRAGSRHRSLFALRLFLIPALRRFNGLRRSRLRIDRHLGIDYGRLNDGIRMRDCLRLFDHPGVPRARRDLGRPLISRWFVRLLCRRFRRSRNDICRKRSRHRKNAHHQ
jgi:hypothetical protein